MDRSGEVVLSPRSRRRVRMREATCPVCGVTYKGEYAGKAVGGCVSYHRHPYKGCFTRSKNVNPVMVGVSDGEK